MGKQTCPQMNAITAVGGAATHQAPRGWGWAGQRRSLCSSTLEKVADAIG